VTDREPIRRHNEALKLSRRFAPRSLTPVRYEAQQGGSGYGRRVKWSGFDTRSRFRWPGVVCRFLGEITVILVVGEDGVVSGYSSPEEVVGSVEALDAEETILAAFDESGRPYRIEWIRPNEYGRKWFGVLQSVTNGTYALVPSGPPDVAAALTVIRSASTLDPTAAKGVAQLEALAAEADMSDRDSS
jgi:hypothetical protein